VKKSAEIFENLTDNSLLMEYPVAHYSMTIKGLIEESKRGGKTSKKKLITDGRQQLKCIIRKKVIGCWLELSGPR
jgi:hypothetical protein